MIEYVIHIPEYLEVLQTKEKLKYKRKCYIPQAISVYVAKSTSASAGGIDVWKINDRFLFYNQRIYDKTSLRSSSNCLGHSCIKLSTSGIGLIRRFLIIERFIFWKFYFRY
jgi:hypothetical protein